MLKTIKAGRGSRIFLMFTHKRSDAANAALPDKENPVRRTITAALLCMTALLITAELFFFVKSHI
jgi:hypothetical protein